MVMSIDAVLRKVAFEHLTANIRNTNAEERPHTLEVLVLPKTIPIDILTNEMRWMRVSPFVVSRANSGYKSGETKDFNSQITVMVGEQLKRKMDSSPCPLYMENKHCELYYFVTHFLTDQAYFTKYLHRSGHVNFPACPNCVDKKEDAKEEDSNMLTQI